MTGYVLAWILVIVCFAYVLPTRHPLVTLAIVYTIPFVVGLLAFRAPILASWLDGRYGAGLRRSVLAKVISTNLALAGMFPTAFILIDRWFADNLEVVSPLFWSVLVLMALAGGIVVYPFNAWLSQRGLGTWPAPAASAAASEPAEEDIALPSWRNAWGAFVVSLILLVGSLGLVIANPS